LFGDPCRACGFDWSLTPTEALRWVSGWGPRLAETVSDAHGSERRVSGGWSITEYVCHVGDNLRQWAERLQSALLAQQFKVAGYDPDALAAARGYAALPLAAAAWSSELAAAAWVDVAGRAVDQGSVCATRRGGRSEPRMSLATTATMPTTISGISSKYWPFRDRRGGLTDITRHSCRMGAATFRGGLRKRLTRCLRQRVRT
jgi:hypothetical protein